MKGIFAVGVGASVGNEEWSGMYSPYYESLDTNGTGWRSGCGFSKAISVQHFAELKPKEQKQY